MKPRPPSTLLKRATGASVSMMLLAIACGGSEPSNPAPAAGAGGTTPMSNGSSAGAPIGSTGGGVQPSQETSGGARAAGAPNATAGANGGPSPCGVAARACWPGELPPNILMVLLDDVGLDVIGAYQLAEDAPPTPTIDSLAQEGIVFTQAYSQPWCSPTRAGILTGRSSPRDFQMGRAIRAELDAEVSLPLDSLTIPEALDLHSPWMWDHALAGKWHLTKLADGPADAPLRHGFGHFWGGLANPYQRHALDGQPQDHYDWERSVDGVVERTTTYSTTQITDDALALISEMNSPWFLWMATFAAHDPYQLPPSELHSYEQVAANDAHSAYRAMVEAVDHELGRMLASLPQDVRENTLIILLGDNGTPTGLSTPAFQGSPTKGSVFQGGVHVPFIVSGPIVASPGRTHEGLVHVQDIFATIMDIAGVAASELPPELDSVSFLPQLLDPNRASGRSLLKSEAYDPNGPGPHQTHQQMAFDGRYKLIRRKGLPDELYDLGGGLLEQAPLDPLGLSADQQSARERLTAHLVPSE